MAVTTPLSNLFYLPNIFLSVGKRKQRLQLDQRAGLPDFRENYVQ